MSWKIETATPSDCRELTAFLDRAFGLPEDFFRLGLGHIYPEAEMHRNWVVRDQGRIVGVFGLFPMTYRLGGVGLDAWGVGGVSADPEHRGRGIMSTFLQAAQTELRNRKADISWLGGNRERYGRYGWEQAGCRRWSVIDRRSPITAAPDEARRINPKHHLHEIDALFRAMPLRTERPLAMLERHIARPQFEWWLADGAYAVRRSGEPSQILEICGSGEGAERLLAALRSSCDTPLKVQTPNDDHPVSRTVQRLASTSTTGQLGALKIIDLVSTLTKLIPVMERNLHPLSGRNACNLVMLDPLPDDPGFVQIVNLSVEEGSVRVQPGAGRGPALTLDRREMAMLIFGRWGETVEIPEGFALLRHLLPAPLHSYELDQV